MLELVTICDSNCKIVYSPHCKGVKYLFPPIGKRKFVLALYED